MVTSNRARAVSPELGDVEVSDWQAAGLLRPSVVRTGRLLVLEQRLLAQPRGRLMVDDIVAIDSGLRDVLGL
jgi:hypothetical protein